jgi:hypothetical protein
MGGLTPRPSSLIILLGMQAGKPIPVLSLRERALAQPMVSLTIGSADRKRWAERMHAKGYVSRVQVVSEDLFLKRAAGALGLPY